MKKTITAIVIATVIAITTTAAADRLVKIDGVWTNVKSASAQPAQANIAAQETTPDGDFKIHKVKQNGTFMEILVESKYKGFADCTGFDRNGAPVATQSWMIDSKHTTILMNTTEATRASCSFTAR